MKAVHQSGRQQRRTQTKSETKRLQFDFPLQAVEVLQEMADLTGEPTLAGVLRDALKVYAWVIEEQQHDRRIMSEDKKGQHRRELVPLIKYTGAA